MTERTWYEEVQESGTLRQGDILLDCPVYSINEVPSSPASEFVPTVNLVTHHLLVLSQSCDLEQEKVEQVLLAQVTEWRKLVEESVDSNPFVRSTEFRKKLVEGAIPGYFLLSKSEGSISLPWSLVNFHKLFVLPKQYVSTLATARSPRLRIQSPYLEHLSQAFARYFMRVGLPQPLEAFVKEGK